MNLRNGRGTGCSIFDFQGESKTKLSGDIYSFDINFESAFGPEQIFLNLQDCYWSLQQRQSKYSYNAIYFPLTLER
jgi:hypothetical protein